MDKEMIITVIITLYGVGAMFCASQWYLWRKRAMSLKAFIENPNVEAVDKQAEYKDSFEAQINALDEERRQIQVALLEAFDYLNDNGPFEEGKQTGLMQVRNVLMRAIQISTHGRG
jgi:hypothetical protein